jgi:MFS family permease
VRFVRGAGDARNRVCVRSVNAIDQTAPASVIWALGLTQIIGYGTLYYSFGALAPSMAAEFGWPEAWVYGVLSGSLLAGGLVAPLSGRWADRIGAARLMTWGSVAAAAAMALCAWAPERWSFVAGLVAIEVTSAFVLYSTAFAALAQLSARGARRSITHLTLIAGFASTLFWPLTSALHEQFTWREVYLVYAAMNLVVCAPVHFWLARATRRSAAGAAKGEGKGDVGAVAGEAGRGLLLLMLLGFALLGFVSSAVTVQMVPMLSALGVGGVVVTSLFGPAQVLSRLINMQFGKGLSQPALAMVAALLMPLGLAVLVLTAPWFPGAALFAILFGLGSGLSSIVSGTLPLVLFGTVGYGQRLGWISSARLFVSAMAPFAFSVLAGWGTSRSALGFVIAVGLGAAGAFGAIWWSVRKN